MGISGTEVIRCYSVYFEWLLNIQSNDFILYEIKSECKGSVFG
jgi:hypothetical protein